VQHALRAFTPAEQKAVKAAATTFRANPAFNTEKAIMELGVGEALVSTLDAKGQPTIVERTLVRPPNSRVGPVTDAERKAVIKASKVIFDTDYAESIDRESAFEMLQKRTAKQADAEAAQADDNAGAKKTAGGSRADSFWTTLGKTIVRTGVPMATRVLENVLKNRTKRGGGF